MKKANETFELLSKLLSEKNSSKDSSNELYEKLYATVIQELSVKLNKSSYPEKTRLIADLKEVIDSVEILTQFPELIGKSVLGILGSKGAANNALLDQISSDKVGDKTYKYSKNIPSIIYNGENKESVKVVNMIENAFEITRNDFILANRELYKNNIDIRQFLLSCSISTEMPYENITFINFPYYSLKSQEYYASLIDATDVLVIPTDDFGKWKEDLKYLVNLTKAKSICIVSDKNDLDKINKFVSVNFSKSVFVEEFTELNKNSGNSPKIMSCAVNDFIKNLGKLNCARDNVAISELFLGILNRYRLYQTEKIEKIKNSIRGINEDLINIESEETSDSIRELKKQLDESLESIYSELSDFKVLLENLTEAVGDFENSLYSQSKVLNKDVIDKKILYHGEYEENCSNLIFDFIEIGEFHLANKYINILKSRKSPYIYIYELYMDEKMNRKLLKLNLIKLKSENSKKNIVLKAKVKFCEYISLDIEEIGECIKLISGPLDGYENYKLGEYYSRINGSKAEKYYKKSLEKGYLEAGDKLIEYIDSNDYLKLEPLAKMLVPEANYLCGLMALKNHKYAKGITYLKIAAVFEHLGAISKLANIEFANKGKKSERISFQLFTYLYEKNPTNLDVAEKLGQMYYWQSEHRKAFKLLNKCNTKNALYTCGRMYQYGDGVVQNLDEAKKLFKKASKKGHLKANAEYKKVCEWIEDNEEREEELYSNDTDYSTSSSSSYDSSSSGWCFLTTATCLALGKGDDCEELNVLRRYRDERLILDNDGPEIIREYYRVAPIILKSIERERTSIELFKLLYTEYISVICNDIKNNNYIKAKKGYVEMVKKLCKKYNVELRYSEI